MAMSSTRGSGKNFWKIVSTRAQSLEKNKLLKLQKPTRDQVSRGKKK